jgi:hypothetical protein
VCRLKKNRRFNGHALRHHRRHPYWAECGWLSGGLKSPDAVSCRGAPTL